MVCKPEQVQDSKISPVKSRHIQDSPELGNASKHPSGTPHRTRASSSGNWNVDTRQALMHIQRMARRNLHLFALNQQNTIRDSHVAVFDWVDVDVVEICPEIAFVTGESIPVLVPDLSPRCIVQLVQLYGTVTVQPLDEFPDGSNTTGLEQQVIVICQNDPSP
jgi:hypothetical protein